MFLASATFSCAQNKICCSCKALLSDEFFIQANMLTYFLFPFSLKKISPVGSPKKLIQKVQTILRLLWGDPRFLVMSWLARFIAVREWVADRGRYQPLATPAAIDATVIEAPAGARSLETSGQVAKLIQAHGYYVGFSLQNSTLQDLLTFAETAPCYANRDPALPFYIKNKDQFEQELGARLLVAGYLDAHETCDAYQKLKTDPYLLDVAGQYLNHSAVYMRGELAWGFPTPNTLAEKVSTARVYHCDINDFKTIKFFFYLTEVGEGEGPHAYIKGTHRHRRFGHQWIGQGCAAIDDEVLMESYGRDRVHVITGPAGLGFAGDPYCLHKGGVPYQQPRLLLQLEFGIYPYRIWYF